jgi:hypothetical protein
MNTFASFIYILIIHVDQNEQRLVGCGNKPDSIEREFAAGPSGMLTGRGSPRPFPNTGRYGFPATYRSLVVERISGDSMGTSAVVLLLFPTVYVNATISEIKIISFLPF